MRTHESHAKLSQLISNTEGIVRSFDGTKIWYKSVGRGVPIICCNGLGCSTFYFKYLEAYFKRSHQMITWDYRGHGKSEYPKHRKNHTVGALVKDLKGVMETLKIEKAILIGHSMGTQILYEFYSQYPEKVSALVSCFGTFGKPMDTLYNSSLSKYIFEGIYLFNHAFPRLANTIGSLMVKNPFWFQLGGIFKLMKPYLVDKAVLKQYIEHIVNVDPIFLANLTRSLQEHNAEPMLRNIRVPTLILGAEDDAFTPSWVSKKMHHLIPQSELMVIKKGSHVALIEQPELINLRIEKFLSETVLKRRLSSLRKAKILALPKRAAM